MKYTYYIFNGPLVLDVSTSIVSSHQEYARLSKNIKNLEVEVVTSDKFERVKKFKTEEGYTMLANTALDDWEVKQFEKYLANSYNKTMQGELNVNPGKVVEKDHINPTHYKSVAAGKQYIELMQDLLEGYSGVEAHLLGQIYKYSMRLGKKDSKEQDATKISWYAQCLADYYKTGQVKTGWQ